MLAIAALFVANSPSTAQSATDAAGSLHEPVSIRTAGPLPSADLGSRGRIGGVYERLPLFFETNQGQSAPEVKFISRGAGYAVFLTSREAVLVLTQQASIASDRRDIGKPIGGTALRMSFVGGNAEPRVTGQEGLAGKVNYFVGKEPAKWRTQVATYSRVHYQDLYPGIDLVYYGTQRQLEYDLVVAPGADPSRIVLDIQGADKVEVDAAGDLLLYTRIGLIRQHNPVIYQEIDGLRRQVAGSYAITGRDQVGFRMAAYDRSLPLTIDPVLAYSTYLGGASVDIGRGIAVDTDGNAYVTGTTCSPDFPKTPGAFDQLLASCDAFVTKLDPMAATLVYSTYFGSRFDDYAYGISVDSSGNAYVTGYTGWGDFPTTPGAFDTGLSGSTDAFVTKLDATGATLAYSTYLGGGSADFGYGIAVDTGGNAYVTGQTSSADFPMTGSFDPTRGGSDDAFVTKLDPTGTTLGYSTYLGGSDFDAGLGIAVDSVWNAYVVGYSVSGDFPTTPGAFDSSYNGTYDAFVTKLDATGATLAYSTYLGGSSDDFGYGIAVDTGQNAYVTGYTASVNLPTTAGAFAQTNNSGSIDAFVTKLDATGSTLAYSTYFGGSSDDFSGGIAVDSVGNAYVTGSTRSGDLPTTPGAFDPTYNGDFDAFMTKLDATGATVVYSTYLGGSAYDVGFSVAVDTPGNAYVTGHVYSPDFPTTSSAFDQTFGGGADAFVVKIAEAPPPTTTVDMYLHGAGPNANPATLFLDSSAPTATDPKFKDSAAVQFAGGNAWKQIGIWTAASESSPRTLTSLSDFHDWVGLKNSDDQGTQFDERAEIYKNGMLVASGITRCITGVTRNPNLAKEVTVAFDPFAPVPLSSGDVLSLRVLTRIGTNPNGSKCPGPGGSHSSAVGLRVYFDAASRPSRFDATFAP